MGPFWFDQQCKSSSHEFFSSIFSSSFAIAMAVDVMLANSEGRYHFVCLVGYAVRCNSHSAKQFVKLYLTRTMLRPFVQILISSKRGSE